MKPTVIAIACGLTVAASSLVLAQATPQAPQSPPAATTQGGQPMWYSQQAGDMRASELIGASVTNTANETIGEINDIVLSKDGNIAAIVVGVGGFLGLGEREVAMDFKSVRMSRDQNDDLVLTVDATRDDLMDAPAWR